MGRVPVPHGVVRTGAAQAGRSWRSRGGGGRSTAHSPLVLPTTVASCRVHLPSDSPGDTPSGSPTVPASAASCGQLVGRHDVEHRDQQDRNGYALDEEHLANALSPGSTTPNHRALWAPAGSPTAGRALPPPSGTRKKRGRAHDARHSLLLRPRPPARQRRRTRAPAYQRASGRDCRRRGHDLPTGPPTTSHVGLRDRTTEACRPEGELHLEAFHGSRGIPEPDPSAQCSPARTHSRRAPRNLTTRQ